MSSTAALPKSRAHVERRSRSHDAISILRASNPCPATHRYPTKSMIAALTSGVRACHLATSSRSAKSVQADADRGERYRRNCHAAKRLAESEPRVQFPPLAPSRFRPGMAVRHLAPLDRRAAELRRPPQ